MEQGHGNPVPRLECWLNGRIEAIEAIEREMCQISWRGRVSSPSTMTSGLQKQQGRKRSTLAGPMFQQTLAPGFSGSCNLNSKNSRQQ